MDISYVSIFKPLNSIGLQVKGVFDRDLDFHRNVLDPDSLKKCVGVMTPGCPKAPIS